MSTTEKASSAQNRGRLDYQKIIQLEGAIGGGILKGNIELIPDRERIDKYSEPAISIGALSETI